MTQILPLLIERAENLQVLSVRGNFNVPKEQQPLLIEFAQKCHNLKSISMDCGNALLILLLNVTALVCLPSLHGVVSDTERQQGRCEGLWLILSHLPASSIKGLSVTIGKLPTSLPDGDWPPVSSSLEKVQSLTLQTGIPEEAVISAICQTFPGLTRFEDFTGQKDWTDSHGIEERYPDLQHLGVSEKYERFHLQFME